MDDQSTAILETAELVTERLPLSSVSPYQDQIIHGNCIDTLREMPSDSVDLVATDPPYGISSRQKARSPRSWICLTRRLGIETWASQR